jgi:hypothetical protein
LPKLAFVVEVLVGYALAWKAFKDHTRTVNRRGIDTDAWSCCGVTCVLLQKRTRDELTLDFEFGNDRTAAEGFAGGEHFCAVSWFPESGGGVGTLVRSRKEVFHSHFGDA